MALFLLYWGGKKVVPFLQTKPAETYATPTSQPTDPSVLAPIKVKGKGGEVCLQGIEFGPGAKYVYVTVQAERPAGPIALRLSAPGYRATARQAGELKGTVPLHVPVTPAAREVGGGTLCLRNEGRHRTAFYGVPPGRGSAPVTTTVDGRVIKQQLSVTLLTSPSKSLGSRLGTMFDHMAAFRPVTGWEIWILALLLAVGVPVAIAVALLRSAAADDEPPAA
jgi:hypothetical protein